MSYSIFVRKAGARGTAPELLAYDFDHEGAARDAVRSIATSYSEHGCDPFNDCYWFRSAKGVMQIFVYRDAVI